MNVNVFVFRKQTSNVQNFSHDVKHLLDSSAHGKEKAISHPCQVLHSRSHFVKRRKKKTKHIREEVRENIHVLQFANKLLDFLILCPHRHACFRKTRSNQILTFANFVHPQKNQAK